MSVHQLFKEGSQWQDVRAKTVHADSISSRDTDSFLTITSPIAYTKGVYAMDIGGGFATTVNVATPSGAVTISNYDPLGSGDNVTVTLQFPSGDYSGSFCMLSFGPDNSFNRPALVIRLLEMLATTAEVEFYNTRASMVSTDVTFTYMII